MTLNKEKRDTIVAVSLQRLHKTMSEAISNIENNCWYTAANRLYYACYYAVCALLIKHGITVHTHVGAINQFGLHFPLVEPAEKFIAATENLINNSPTTE